MANTGLTNLVGGFMSAFTQSRRQTQQQGQIDEFKKLQLKKFKADQDIHEQKLKFGEDLFSMMQPSSAPVQGEEGPPRFKEQEKGKSVSELLSDPQGQMLALRSGQFTPKDIGIEQQRQQFKSAFGAGDGADVSQFTPGSVTQARATGDPRQLKAITPIEKVIDTPTGPRRQTFNPFTGEMIADLGPEKEARITAEQAGRISGLQVGKELMTKFKKGLFNEDGTINRKNVLNMSTDIPGMGKGVPFTEGRQLRSEFQSLADGIIRARTGAAMTTDETVEFLHENLPGKFDNDSTIKSKIDRLERFLGGAIDALTLPPRLKKLYDEQLKQARGTTDVSLELPEGIPKGSTLVGTSGGNPVYETSTGERLIVE